ncbi:hypothetical protein MMC11_004299 [Xylographa trunciseda]|nr:hypothetical protein [Xylographa trunciseda]
MSSIFGSARPTLNLFGSLGNTTSAASQSQPGQTSTLFGNNNASQPTSQQLPFSSLGGQSSSQPQPSLFSNLGGQSNPAPQQPPFPSIGGPSTSQQPLFSNPSGQAQSNQAEQSAQAEQVNGAKGSHTAYFDALLEKNRKRRRTAEERSAFGEVPTLELGLGDIAKRVRELGHESGIQNQNNTGADSRAHYLLAASGVNPGAAIRDLNSLHPQGFSSQDAGSRPGWDPDSHKYVEQLQQQSTLRMIADGISRAQQNFDAYLAENIEMNWDAQRKKIYEHFGLTPRGSEAPSDSINNTTPGIMGSFGRSARRGRGGPSDRSSQNTPNRSVFGRSGMQKSVIGTPGVGSGNATVFGEAAEKPNQVIPAQDDRFFRDKQENFAKKVQTLNESRLRGIPYPVLQEFASVEGQAGGDSPTQLIDAYKALVEIVKENPESSSLTDPGTVKERQYAEEYLDETLTSAKAFKVRKMILNGSRKALEKQFYSNLESLVARNPREASLGGIPTIINRVRAYIRIRNSRKDLAPDGIELQILNEDYCWALIFFLLRSGFVKEAAEYVSSNAGPFRALDRNFVTWITEYARDPNRRLPRNQQDRINADYQQRTRMAPENSLDPYRMACYKIIGRCELGKRSIDNISQGVEDWMWLQFSLAREVNRAEEAANEVYGLDEVRGMIREIGQRHFQKGSEGPGGYGTFFYLQILGGLFENAIMYLYPHSYVAAVHFAIALDFYGLFRVSNFSVSESELLTYDTTERPQISFGRMIGYYTRDFRANNPVAAVDYLTLIHLNADLPGELGKSQSSLCHEALRELVLETREFAQLLGDVRSDGTRIKGAIEQRLKLIGIADQEAFLHTVTLQAASIADDNGRTTDAVLLYHLAEDYDNVINIINRTLSEAIAVDIGEEKLMLEPLKPRTDSQNAIKAPEGSSLSLTTVDDPAVLAKNMITVYNGNALYYRKIRSASRDTCGVLLRISEAKGKVEEQQWAEAIDVNILPFFFNEQQRSYTDRVYEQIISSLSLLPLSADSSIPIIRSYAQKLNTLQPNISRLVGPLLLWTMVCISRQCDILSGNDGQGGFETHTRSVMRADLVTKAKDLMVFAGLIKLRLGNGIWDALIGGAAEVGAY